MDFFDQNAPHAITETTQEATEFARALQQRETFIVPTASPRMLQALARSPQAPTYRPEPARPLPSRPPPPISSPFKPFQPEDLSDLISNPSTLFLDIRPHGQWRKARVCRAISLTVPSTLLRRPAFSLDKISTMLPNSRDREEFQKWPSASTILVYDADSANLSESSNISALLTKIKAAGYTGDLGYLYGGINSILLSSLPGVIDNSQPLDDGPAESTSSSNQFIAVRQLSMSAFQQGTTCGYNGAEDSISYISTPFEQARQRMQTNVQSQASLQQVLQVLLPPRSLSQTRSTTIFANTWSFPEE